MRLLLIIASYILTSVIICVGMYRLTHTVKYLHDCGYKRDYVAANAIDTVNLNTYSSYGL